jgi:hypothetical protein
LRSPKKLLVPWVPSVFGYILEIQTNTSFKHLVINAFKTITKLLHVNISNTVSLKNNHSFPDRKQLSKMAGIVNPFSYWLNRKQILTSTPAFNLLQYCMKVHEKSPDSHRYGSRKGESILVALSEN